MCLLTLVAAVAHACLRCTINPRSFGTAGALGLWVHFATVGTFVVVGALLDRGVDLWQIVGLDGG